MSRTKKIFAVLLNVQILSALIWAAVIIGCAYISKNDTIQSILVTAAGFHVVLLSTKLQRSPNAKH